MAEWHIEVENILVKRRIKAAKKDENGHLFSKIATVCKSKI